MPILIGSKVFAFYHHTDPTSATCVDRATGAVCPGYPKRLDFGDGNGFGTTDINGPGVVYGSKIWTHLENSFNYEGSASIGLFCWDYATDSTCGLTIVDRVAETRGSGRIRPDGSPTARCGSAATRASCTASIRSRAPSATDRHGLRPDTDSTSTTTPWRTATACSWRGAIRPASPASTSPQGAECAGWDEPEDRSTVAGTWSTSKNAAGAGRSAYARSSRANGTCYPDADPAATTKITELRQRGLVLPGLLGHSQEAETGQADAGRDRSIADGVGCYDWSTMAPCTGGDYGQTGARLDR